MSDAPIVVVKTTDAGIRFGIADDLFDAWWRSIPTEDQDGFIHFGGDVSLARFVCAFDYLTNRQRVPQPQAIVNAYAATYEVDPESYSARVRGVAAYEHKATQFLIDQFASRSLRSAKDNAVPKFSKLLNTILDEANADGVKLNKRVGALDAATRFFKLMQSEGAKHVVDTGGMKTARPTGRTIDASETAMLDLAKSAPDVEPEPE